MFLYRGGILILSVATALLIAVTTHPASLLGKAVGAAPLRWVGERSYGIYLWHLPVIVFLPAEVLKDSPWRPVLLCTVIVALASLSWALVEDPIRRRGLLGALRRGREHRALAGQRPRREPFPRHAAPRQRAGPRPRGHGRAHRLHGHGPLGLELGGAVADRSQQPAAAPSRRGRDAGRPGDAVRHHLGRAHPLGDDDRAHPDRHGEPQDVLYQRRPCRRLDLGRADEQGLPAQPRRPDRRPVQAVRRGNASTDILGARSIVERWNGQPNAEDGRQDQDGVRLQGLLGVRHGDQRGREPGGRRQHADGQADPAADAARRELAGHVPHRQDAADQGAYAQVQMQKWDDALVAACSTVPEHAGLRLGRRGPGQVVHQRQDPLHDPGLPAARAPHGRGAGHRLPEGRHTAERLPDP